MTEPTPGKIKRDLRNLRQAWEWVGKFFFLWSLLESKLNEGIVKSFGLPSLEGEIIVNNVQLRDKLHILHTIATWEGGFRDEAWRTKTKKVFERIATLSGDRNMLAHTSFSQPKRDM